MKTRLTSPGAARGAWLIAGRSAAGAVLLAVSVSACTGGGSGSAAPSIFTPTPVTSGQAPGGARPGSRTPSPTGAGSSTQKAPSGPGSTTARLPTTTRPTATASSRPPGTATPKPTATRSHHPATTRTRRPSFPTAAPETGGGGTAGLQDSVLFGIGGFAVLSGLGTLAYRRRLRRSLAAGGGTRRERPDRQPAGH
jgi:hypothetical protein